MNFSKSSDWDGAFLPIKKHRDYCGDITNHIIIKSITQLTDDEAVRHDDSDEAEIMIDELEEVGDGGVPYLVEIGFIGGEDLYEFVVWSDEGDPEAIMAHMADALKHPGS